MNRRLVNGLLLLTLATGSCSMFTSCKDTDEDWKNQMVLGQVSVEDKINDLQEQIDNIACHCPDYQAIIDALKADLDGKIANLQAALDNKADKSEVQTLLIQITNAVNRISALETQYNTLNSTVSDIQTTLSQLASRLDGVDTTISGMQGDITNLTNKLNTLINTTIVDLNNQIATINSTLATLQSDMNNAKSDISTLKTDVGTLRTDMETIKTNVTNLQTSLTTIQTSLSTLTNKVTTIETNLGNLTTQVNTNTTAITTLQTNYTNLETKLTNLETSLGGRIQALEDYKTNTIEPALTKLNNLDDQINGENGLAAQLAQAQADIATNATNIAQAIADIAANKSAIDANKTQIDANKAAIAALETSYSNLEKLVAANTKLINELQDTVNLYFSALNSRLNSLITGIILNQTWNPLFGSINLPLGIETTIAANYYGESDHSLEFPLGSGAYEYNGNESALNGLIEDAAAWDNLVNNLKTPESIGYYVFDSNNFNSKNQYEIKGSERYMTDVNNNLGQLYLTINPNNIDFSNVNLSLVNSMDEAAPITLDVKKCNDEILTFGAGSYSRAAENNGFYRANLKVRPADATKIGVRIEEGLKSSMKDALKEHTKGDLARFGKKLVDQLSGILPAYAIKAEWEAPVVETDATGKEVTVNKTFATYSDYNIAATAIKPLGYSFLYGVDFTDHTIGGHHIQLPTYGGSLEELLDKFFDDLHFDIKIDLGKVDNITYDDFKVEFDLSKVDFSFDEPMEIEIKIDLNGTVLTTSQEIEGEDESKEVEITIGGKPGTPEWSENNVITTTLKYNPDGSVELGTMGELAPFVDAIKDAINNFINGAGDQSLAYQINEQINNQLVHKLVDQVNNIINQINNMLVGEENGDGGINGQIQSAIQDVIDQIKNTLGGKLGKIDSLIDKYNSLAKRINKILKNPNHYLQAMMAYEDGTGNLHHLSTNRNVPSSFRFAGGDAIELFMTSYTAELIAPSFAKYVAVSRVYNMKGEKLSDSEAIAKSINDANDYLNVLLPGTLQRVPLKAADLKPGNIYEVVLSYVDYRGYTSSRLYYFMVSK